MGSAAGDTKLGTALKVIDIYTKVEKLIADLKQLAPELHQALHASISDITNTFEDIVSEIGQLIDSNRKSSESISLSKNWRECGSTYVDNKFKSISEPRNSDCSKQNE